MTTNDNIPTPYDSIIDAWNSDDKNYPTWEGYSRARLKAEGYRQAMQDCAPLLAALARIAAWELGQDDGVGADLQQAYHAQQIARGAIAQYERLRQPATPPP